MESPTSHNQSITPLDLDNPSDRDILHSSLQFLSQSPSQQKWTGMSDSTAQLETLAGPEPAHLRHGQQGGHGSKGEDPKPDEPVLRTGMVMAAADAEKQMESRDEEQDEERDGDGQGWLKPTPNFTGHQLWYVFVLDGLGGMLVSGGVNFALAYVMYTTQDTTKNPILLFQLPNTLAGDGAVTIIVQCILTWFIEMGLVSYDLSRRSVQPVGCIPEPSHPLLRWLMFLPTSPGADAKVDVEKPTFTTKIITKLSSIAQQAFRGFLLAIISFFLLWPASVGILTALGSRSGWDWTYSERWTPQGFKAILGGLLGLLTTPLMALFWLVKAGWEADERRLKARELRRDGYRDWWRAKARALRRERYSGQAEAAA